MILRFILFVLCFSMSAGIYSQSIAELNKEKEEIKEEIAMITRLINKTTSSLLSQQEKYKLLIKRLEAREKLITAINAEIRSIETKIKKEQALIDSISDQMHKIQEEYGHLARQVYQWKKISSPYIYILSAESMNQAFRRYYYIKQFEENRKKKRGQLKDLKEKQETVKKSLEATMMQKKEALLHLSEENKGLQADINSMHTTLEKLKAQQESLKANLVKQKRARKELDHTIASLIARNRKKNESSGTASPDIGLTPEAIALGNAFVSNKGKLPWPVKRGFIGKVFGRHRHPALPNVTTMNNGIDITTMEGAQVRSIFKGKVIGIVYVPGYQKMVIIKHGEYYSVYSHLDRVLVEKGLHVDTGTVLGIVFHNKEKQISQVHLEIWHGKNKLNPEDWLLKK